MKRLVVLFAILVLACFKGGLLASDLDVTAHGPYTIAQRVTEYGTAVQARLQPDFAKAGVPYPPQKLTLVILKHERQLQVYAQATGGAYQYIRTYPILAASGQLGPKLREGDGQVPEGIYGVDSLNPNSHYHLALHVDYPNAFDRAMARADGRTNLGGEIMIHGNHVSIGCVAIGDQGAEDLFMLAAKTGLPNVRLLFCPTDFRLAANQPEPWNFTSWTPKLYEPLERALNSLPVPPATP